MKKTMSKDELINALEKLGFSKVEFAALIGVEDRTVRLWTAESGVVRKIPNPVAILTRLILKRPALIAEIERLESS